MRGGADTKGEGTDRELPHDQVGVRELRQNLSVYLRRVKRGESLDVTERGDVVASLVPVVHRTGPLERLRREGLLIVAKERIEDLPPMVGTISDAGSRALEAVREDRV